LKIVIKVVEIIGTSTNSWEEAAKNAVEEASKTIRGITGIDVVNQTATVKEGKIVKYKTCCKIAFAVED